MLTMREASTSGLAESTAIAARRSAAEESAAFK